MTDERRAKLKASILDYFKDINYHMNNCMAYDSLNKMLDRLIDEAEERPHGEWKHNPKSLWDIADCSVCGEMCIGFWSANFCPNCGARMKGGDEK